MRLSTITDKQCTASRDRDEGFETECPRVFYFTTLAEDKRILSISTNNCVVIHYQRKLIQAVKTRGNFHFFLGGEGAVKVEASNLNRPIFVMSILKLKMFRKIPNQSTATNGNMEN